MIPGLINLAWSASMRRAERRFRHALQHPANAQREVLLALTAGNSKTAFGQDHRFGQIRSIDDFRRYVPLGDYATHEPYITRIQKGEPSVLTRDTVTHLIPTSGSSGARKLIPYTESLQTQFDAALGPWVRDMFRRFPDARKGRAYWSVSPAIPSDERSVVKIGFQDDTDYLSPIGRLLVRRILAVPSEVRHITDSDRFWRTTALHLLAAKDLSLISVWHPSYLGRLLEVLADQWNELLDELPNKHANRLRQCKPDAVREIWPQLALVSVWADASAALPYDRIKERMPGIDFQPKGLLATEGWTTIPYQGARPIAIQTHFFEFIDQSGEPRLCEELVTGQSYETVITTAGGLYRYRTGDRVLVTGMVEATPTLQFLGRDHATSDLCGEKLNESHVSNCLASVFQKSGYAPNDQLLIPEDAHAPTRYLLLLSGPTPPPVLVEEQLDTALCENPHYSLARKLGQLDAASVIWQPGPFRKLDSHKHTPIGALKPSIIASHASLSEIMTYRLKGSRTSTISTTDETSPNR
jgi:hypothetical protein